MTPKKATVIKYLEDVSRMELNLYSNVLQTKEEKMGHLDNTADLHRAIATLMRIESKIKTKK